MLRGLPPVVRFGIAGIGNTLLGFTIIFLGLQLGVNDVIANACGYVAGLALGFVVNRRWTFNMNGQTGGDEVGRYIGAFALSWCANLLIVIAGVHAGFSGSPWVHLTGMAIYTGVFFMLSRHFVFVHNGPDLGKLAYRHLGEIIVIPATLLAMVMMRGIGLTHDVIWQLWIARQMQHGVSLYSQINEVNPPLWFWMALVVDRIAMIFAVSPRNVLVWALCLLTLAASLLVGRVGQFQRPEERAWAMTATFASSLFVSIYDFGQREQIALICAIPYAFLIGARIDKRNVPVGNTLVIAFLASLGFALKHYFAVVPLMLEALLFFRQRRSYRPFRIETMVLGISAIVYCIAILLFAPDFLHRIVPMVVLAYDGYNAPIWQWFDEPAQALWAFALVALAIGGTWRKLASKADFQTLATCTFGFAVAYIMQRKGWQYHAIPTSGMTIMTLAGAGFVPPQRVKNLIERPLIGSVIGLFFALSFFQGFYTSNREKLVSPLLDRVPAGGAVMIIASNPMWGWPGVENHRLVWASRYFSHWMLPAIGHARAVHAPDPAWKKLEHTIKNETYDDMLCSSPDLILIENHEPNFVFRPISFDTLTFFSEDSRFRSYLSRNYKLSTNGYGLRVFYRMTPLTPPPAGCRAVW